MIAGHHATRVVRVDAPARLHLGFLDLAFDLGRRFGSIGLAIDWPVTRIEMSSAKDLVVNGDEADRGARIVYGLAAELGLDTGVHLVIHEAIPAHAGLGSGTQLALAVGAAFCALHDKPAAPRQLAAILGRGARTSIGIAAFAEGGFLVDGGIGSAGGLAPILARASFPDEWRVVLVLDQSETGLHGAAETQAFGALKPFPSSSADRLCRLALLGVMPALAEHDLDAFASTITEIQKLLGEHYAPVQGGRFTSRKVAAVLSSLEAQGIGIGQSSWGPTGFAFVGSEREAQRLKMALISRNADPALDFVICRGRNLGAAIAEHDRTHTQGEMEICPNLTSSTCCRH
jgi:beta-RFAP synthase